MALVILYILLLFVKHGASEKSHLRVWGGRDATKDEFPYVLRVEVRMKDNDKSCKKLMCTCAVLSPTYSLTAAYCHDRVEKYYDVDNEIIVITYGSHVPGNPEERVSKIHEIIPHPAYTRSVIFKTVTVKNDIALIRHEPIEMRTYAKIAAADYGSLTGVESFNVGYGGSKYNSSTSVEMDALESQKPLQVSKIVIKRCDAWDVGAPVSPGAKTAFYMDPSICMGRACMQATYSCVADVGGPVMHPDGIVGVNAVAISCDDPWHRQFAHVNGFVGMATPVSPFLEWIASHVSASVYERPPDTENKGYISISERDELEK